MILASIPAEVAKIIKVLKFVSEVSDESVIFHPFTNMTSCKRCGATKLN